MLSTIRHGVNDLNSVSILTNPYAPRTAKAHAGLNLASDLSSGVSYAGGLLTSGTPGVAGDVAAEVVPELGNTGALAGTAAEGAVNTAMQGAQNFLKVAPIAAGALSIWDIAEHGASGSNIGGLLGAGMALAGAGPWALVPAVGGFVLDKLGLFGDGTERAHVNNLHDFQYDPETGEWKLWTKITRFENGTPVKAKVLRDYDNQIAENQRQLLNAVTDQYEQLAPGFKDYIAWKDFQHEASWQAETEKEVKKTAERNTKEFSKNILMPISKEFSEYLKQHPEYQEKLVPLEGKDFNGYVDPNTGLVFDEWYGLQGQINPTDHKFYSVNWYLEPKDFSDYDIKIEDEKLQENNQGAQENRQPQEGQVTPSSGNVFQYGDDMKVSEFYNQQNAPIAQQGNTQQPQTRSSVMLPETRPKTTQDIALIDPRTEEGKTLQAKFMQVLGEDIPKIRQAAYNTPPPLQINGRKLIPKGALNMQQQVLENYMAPSKLVGAAAMKVPWSKEARTLSTQWEYPASEQAMELERIQARGQAAADQYRQRLEADEDMKSDWEKAGEVMGGIGGVLQTTDEIIDVGGKLWDNTLGRWLTPEESSSLPDTYFTDSNAGFEGYAPPGDYSYDPFADEYALF